MIFVQDVELTPNPQALKFILNKEITKNGARHFSNKEEASEDLLAKEIFQIPGIKSLFYSKRFITIEKEPLVKWGEIQKPLVSLIKNFDESLLPLESPEEKNLAATSPELEKINKVLDEYIRPALENDGGGLQIVDFTNNTLKIKYQGACGSCPAAIHGTLVMIENLLKKEVDSKIEVKAAL